MLPDPRQHILRDAPHIRYHDFDEVGQLAGIKHEPGVVREYSLLSCRRTLPEQPFEYTPVLIADLEPKLRVALQHPIRHAAVFELDLTQKLGRLVYHVADQLNHHLGALQIQSSGKPAVDGRNLLLPGTLP